MIVEKLKCDKKRYLALLLLGDEQEYMSDRYIDRGDLFVGITLDFYKSCGYSFSHRIPDFFTDNYDHPVIDGGIVLRDMVYMKKTPGRKPTSFS